MTPAMKQLIIDLRSGKFVQGHGRLCTMEIKTDVDDNTIVTVCFLCCLGVAAERIVPEEQKRIVTHPLLTKKSYYFATTELTQTMLSQLGLCLREQQGMIHLNDGFVWFASDNKVRAEITPHTFLEIADILVAWLIPDEMYVEQYEAMLDEMQEKKLGWGVSHESL